MESEGEAGDGLTRTNSTTHSRWAKLHAGAEFLELELVRETSLPPSLPPSALLCLPAVGRALLCLALL